MRRIKHILQAGGAAIVVAGSLAVGSPAAARADVANVPSLVISQLEITSHGQFITLYNATDSALDMSTYQLEYFNNYDLSKASTSKLISLSGSVPPHGYFMVNDGALLLCYQLTVDSASLGLSTAAGMVEVLAFGQTIPGGSVTPVLQDYVGWSKTPAPDAQTLPDLAGAFLQRQPLGSQNNPLIDTPGAGSWQTVQPDPSNPCQLVTPNDTPAPPLISGQLLPPAEPPATIQSLADSSGAAAAPVLPRADVGLMAPTVTELLPNPAGTGNDGTDEFIELYNPNTTSFDLSGFELQSGTTSLHHYAFPDGAHLAPHSFTAFYSADTHLSLSNTAGQVTLLDPLGKPLSATGVYGAAKDGQAWALARGTWYWTSSPTPGKANVVNQASAGKKSGSKEDPKNQKSAARQTAAVTSADSSGGDAAQAGSLTPIHRWTLVLAAVAAVLYGTYEYRADLKNRIYQFRCYLRVRRTDRA